MEAIAYPPEHRDRPNLAAILITAALHAGLLALLLRTTASTDAPAQPVPAQRTEVVFLPPAEMSDPQVTPPWPAMPQRARRVEPGPTSVPAPDAATEAAATRSDPAPSPRRLDLRLPPALRGDRERLAPRDPMRYVAPRLAGREEAYVEGIVMRPSATPAEWVAMIGGMFFGGNRDPCIDIRSLIASAESEVELRDLYDRERRYRCR